MVFNRTKLTRAKAWWPALLTLGLILTALFHQSFAERQTLFSNDGPLGLLEAQGQPAERTSNFLGVWQPLNWVGNATYPLMPSLSHAFFWASGPMVYSKFYAPLALLFLGMAMAVLFIRSGAPPAVVALVAIAAALNSDALSHACWGLPPIALGMGFAVLAVAALTGEGPIGIRRLVLAGFAVGLAVTESYDVGAILSLYVAAFVLFQALTAEGKPGRRAARGVGGVALVATAAALISAQALSTLIGTQVKGVAGMAQDEATRAQRWREATQWSLPKLETLQIVVPGLFGYRMDTPDGGGYWGGVGRDPAWDNYLANPNPDPSAAPAGALLRHSGAGFYAGTLVVLVAVWALVTSWRKQGNPYMGQERRYIWFWAGAALISLLLAYGRHAPFYQVVYQLPFFSTIRNPIKFLHPLQISLIILFGYGLQGLWRAYLEPARAKFPTLSEQLREWWTVAVPGERKWVLGSVAAVVVAGLAWLLYISSTPSMGAHLVRVGFGDPPELAREMARFSAGQAGIAFLFLAASVASLVLILSGRWSGERRRWAVILMGVILVGDLARANLPWIVYYDHRERYASNALIEFLREDAWKHRVTGRVMPMGGGALVNDQGQIFASLYNEWLEHLFPYYQVQTLDIVQMPRTPVLDTNYLGAFRPVNSRDFRRAGRLWELTNTRYVLGMTGFLDFLNQQFDPGQGRFRVHTAFNVGAKPGVDRIERLAQLTVEPATNAPFALFEFEGALPRASLMPRWEVVTNDTACLERLRDPGFDPHRTVLVSEAIPASSAMAEAGAEGSVAVEQYEPKRVRLRAAVETPSVLLLNDRYHPDWSVYVEGQRRELLRCNYIMRGVLLEPGQQTIEFRFEPSFTALYLSLTALAAGLVLLITGFLGASQGAGRSGNGETPGTRSTTSPRRR